MTLSGGETAGWVVGGVVVGLLLLYLGLRWYTWRRAQRVDPRMPRVAVDPKEYAGTWFEQARYPVSFERGCRRTTATYSVEGDRIRVENRCFRNGRWTTARGWAYPTGQDGVLGVAFVPGLYGNYTVTYRDPETSIVTNTDRTQLWLLTRRPHLSAKKREQLLAWLRAHEFDTSRLEFEGDR